MRRGPSRLSALLIMAAAALLALLCPPAGMAQALAPSQAERLVSDSRSPPPDDAPWQRVSLPDGVTADAVWYRVRFAVPPRLEASWAVYLPYWYGGGTVWVNGSVIARVAENTAERRVRWERPHLLPVPDALLRPGQTNTLLLRAAVAPQPSAVGVPPLVLGEHPELLRLFERRLFWVRTMPQVTIASCVVVGGFVVFIWLRRRSELLYGLFGAAALLWAARTATFVIEVMPAPAWQTWRTIYHAANGGFVVVMALFALRLGGWSLPRLERALIAYWLLGPIAYFLTGGSENLVNRLWTGGLIPIGLGLLAVTAVAAWRRRSGPTIAFAVTVALAVAAGIHDYLLAWRSPLILSTLPGWSGDRVFLLHHGANLLLLVMGGVLTARFVGTLGQLEELNRTLEDRVAARETELSRNYRRLSLLERERAALEERQRMTRDLHDGLGSQLFTTLARVDRGELDRPGIAGALRSCIADMRLVIDSLGSDGADFGAALGNFRYRWEQQLRAAGITPQWQVDLGEQEPRLSPQALLHWLRLLQEALTNVLKHAGAQTVQVRIAARPGELQLGVEDDGRGPPDGNGAGLHGRGLANMRERARRLGGSLAVGPGAQGRGWCVALSLPLREDGTAPAAAPASRPERERPADEFAS